MSDFVKMYRAVGTIDIQKLPSDYGFLTTENLKNCSQISSINRDFKSIDVRCCRTVFRFSIHHKLSNLPYISKVSSIDSPAVFGMWKI